MLCHVVRKVSISDDTEVFTYVPEPADGEVLEMKPLVHECRRMRWIQQAQEAPSTGSTLQLSTPSSELWLRRRRNSA